MLNGLDLFSGYGGITLALRELVRPVAYCEIERYSQSILLSRMSEGLLPRAPIWDDVETLTRGHLPTKIDIIYGGFPCQDISVAGNGAGLEGKRSGLFYEVCRLVKEINPRFVFLENVPAIRTRGLREVVREFTDLGYGCRWTCVSAKEVGAPHLRKRWFLLAYSKHTRLNGSSALESSGETVQYGKEGSDETCESEGSNSQRVLSANQTLRSQDSWKTEPNVGRVVDGCAFRVDRIKALGNGVVPAQVKEAFKRLINPQEETK